MISLGKISLNHISFIDRLVIIVLTTVCLGNKVQIIVKVYVLNKLSFFLEMIQKPQTIIY